MDRRFFDNQDSFTSTAYGEVEVDWLEDDEAHLFKFNLPGLRTTDVKVQFLDNDTLQISGIRKDPDRLSPGKWHLKERPSGRFLRQFQLPGNVLVDEVTAYDENGVLVVRVPLKKLIIRNIPIAML